MKTGKFELFNVNLNIQVFSCKNIWIKELKCINSDREQALSTGTPPSLIW